MPQVVWEVRRNGKVYGNGVSEDVTEASPYPFDEYVGENLPSDFEGEVVKREVYATPKYQSEGWVPHISQREHMEMYGGGQ